MKLSSAGLVVYRRRPDAGIEVFLVHPGGPFWAGKEMHAWSIPKGEIRPGEDPLVAAQREFAEEVGQEITGTFTALAPCRQSGGKIVHAWAVEADVDVAKVVSNTFDLEWPPRSGQIRQFPEVDRGGWFGLSEAREKMHKGQVPIVDELAAKLGAAEK